MSADTDLLTRLRTAFAPGQPDRLGVAVSGGGDSIALLYLLHDWRQAGGPSLSVVTVDHRLRPEAAAEAAAVAGTCARLGVSHVTLSWDRQEVSGNLLNEARRARYRLIADWAQGAGIGTVALGHTADDQAETFLMRLARGSGVDGLSAMSPSRAHLGITWVRPLLWARREELRDYLLSRGIGWIDDPTNDDLAFERIRARQALVHLAPLGITREGLIATANRLSMAREALGQTAREVGHRAARFVAGDIILDRAILVEAPFDIQMRLLAQALMWVSAADYRPRFSALTSTYTALISGRRATIGGCLVLPRKGGFHITREARAVAAAACPTDAIWDHRWHLAGPHSPDLEVRALGKAGLSACTGWRSTGLPQASLLASPAIWRAAELVSAPLAGRLSGWSACLTRSPDDFFRGLIAH